MTKMLTWMTRVTKVMVQPLFPKVLESKDPIHRKSGPTLPNKERSVFRRILERGLPVGEKVTSLKDSPTKSYQKSK